MPRFAPGEVGISSQRSPLLRRRSLRSSSTTTSRRARSEPVVSRPQFPASRSGLGETATVYIDYDDREPQGHSVECARAGHRPVEGRTSAGRRYPAGRVDRLRAGSRSATTFVSEPRWGTTGSRWFEDRGASAWCRAEHPSEASRPGRPAFAVVCVPADRLQDTVLQDTFGIQPVSSVELLVADAKRHHLARPRRYRAGVETTSRPGQACVLADSEDDPPIPASRCSRPGRRRRRRRACPARRRSGGRGRRPCRSRSPASARAGRAPPSRGSMPCVMIVPVT